MANATRSELIDRAADLDARALIQLGIHDGPGAFEGSFDRALAVAVYIIGLHGFEDDCGGNTDHGLHGSRVAQYVLWTNSSGFHTLEEFDSAEIAQKALEEWAFLLESEP